MKIKKLAAIAFAAALLVTNTAVISAPAAFAEADEENGFSEELSIAEGAIESPTEFFDDFESYEEIGDNHSTVDTMNDLYANGWSVAADSQFTERNELDSNQRFASIVNEDGNKVLELSTSKALGRMLDPSTQTPSGSYEVSFKFRPVDLGKKQMLFDLSLNSFNEQSNIAKHNILYSYNGMKMGHRTNNISVPMTQVGEAEAVWYDVKNRVYEIRYIVF